MPTALGHPSFRLAELKIIGSAGTDWYPRSGQCARRKSGWKGERIDSKESTGDPWKNWIEGTMELKKDRLGL